LWDNFVAYRAKSVGDVSRHDAYNSYIAMILN